MAQQRVIWTETAAKQRNQILRYWVNHNKSNAYSIKLLELSNEKTRQISHNPRMYQMSEHPNTRVASLGNFSIFFKIGKNTILITAFWDNRQDPKKLVKELNESKQ